MKCIGIDLGTTYSCVGIYENNSVSILVNEHGNRITPSYISFIDNERYIGEIAKEQLVLHPLNTIYDVKRLIGRQYDMVNTYRYPYIINNVNNMPEIEINNKNFKPEFISAMIIEKMKLIAENYCGEKISNAVITVPAYFNDNQRQLTKIAGEIAGLNVMRIINEPTAAAIAYKLNENINEEKNILIYDLGGGTLDVSILTVDDTGLMEVIATSGDTHLGGEDFDNMISDYCISEFIKKNFKPKIQLEKEELELLLLRYNIKNINEINKNMLNNNNITIINYIINIKIENYINEIIIMKETVIELNSNPKYISKLKKHCEECKKSLSNNNISTINIDSFYNNIDLSIKITRELFEKINTNLFNRCLEPVEFAIKDAKIKQDKITDIVLIGGSTRIPKIRELLITKFGNIIRTHINPDEAVAYGATMQCAILSGMCNNITLIDVIPLTIGIETSGGVMTPLIKRNTSIPYSVEQTFSTFTDNQTTVTISIYEGERTLVEHNNLLGTFELDNIKPAPKGIPKIKILCNIDANGIMNIKAIEEISGHNVDIIIKNDKNKLTQEQINNMILEAEKYNITDENIKKANLSKIQLELYITHLKKHIMNTEIIDKINELEEWLNKSKILEDYNIYNMIKEELELLVLNQLYNETYHNNNNNNISLHG
jgi:heat shock protein 5